MVDGRNCVQGDANGKQGYYEIDCTNPACCRGKTVRLQYLTAGRRTYLNLQYIGVEGTKVPARIAMTEMSRDEHGHGTVHGRQVPH